MLVNKIKSTRGITLVELMVAIVIFTMVVGITYSIYISNVKYITNQEIKTQLQNEAQIIDSTFLQIGMQSEGIVNSHITNLSKLEDGDYIDMKFKDEDNQDRYVRWKIEGATLKLQTMSKDDEYSNKVNSEYVLSENVTEATINAIDGKTLEQSYIVNIGITLEKSKGFSDLKYPFSVIVNFRNKNMKN
ncbi:PulJ/GspJ family protein [Terrisporobacter sp.]